MCCPAARDKSKIMSGKFIFLWIVQPDKYKYSFFKYNSLLSIIKEIKKMHPTDSQ